MEAPHQQVGGWQNGAERGPAPDQLPNCPDAAGPALSALHTLDTAAWLSVLSESEDGEVMLKNLAENRLQEAAQSFLNFLFFFLQDKMEYNDAVFGPAALLLSGKNSSQLEILHAF